MTNIIDFQEMLLKKDGVDKSSEYTDDSGVVWGKYTCAFTHKNIKFAFEIWATSFDDADDKICAIIDNGEVVGRILEEID